MSTLFNFPLSYLYQLECKECEIAMPQSSRKPTNALASYSFLLSEWKPGGQMTSLAGASCSALPRQLRLVGRTLFSLQKSEFFLVI